MRLPLTVNFLITLAMMVMEIVSQRPVRKTRQKITVSNDRGDYYYTSRQCASSTCNYETMLPVVPLGYCAFYGDCCIDAVDVSRRNLERTILGHNWQEIQRIHEVMSPVCRKLDIGFQGDELVPTFVYVQTAAEYDECGNVNEEITAYNKLNSTEIKQRLPVYHEGLGIVFANMKCAQYYSNHLNMANIRRLPLAVTCNRSVDNLELLNSGGDLFEQGIFCQYSINISAVQQSFPKLAMCISMEEVFPCASNSDENPNLNKFSSCTWEDATMGLLVKTDQRHDSIFKMCTKQDDWLSQCRREEETTTSNFLRLHLKSDNVTCMKEGDMIAPNKEAQHLAMVVRFQRSDFSYRYMFDLQKLAANEEAMHTREAAMCSRVGREIFIERWQICVQRNHGEITIGVQPQSPFSPPVPSAGGEQSETEWLDFSSSFFILGEENLSNGTLAVLKKEGDPQIILNSVCFRYNALTGHFLVSYRCLCEIFRRSLENAQSSSLTRSIIPRDDSILSLAGSLSILLSLLCLFAVIFVLTAFPQLRNRPAKLVMLLSAFLSIGMIMILVNVYVDVTIVRPRHKKEPTYEENCLRSSPWKEAVCNLIGIFLHFSYLATFCLSSALYIDLWRSVRKSAIPGHSSSHIWALVLPCLAVPLVIVLTAVFIDQLSPNHDLAPRYAEFVCWISEPNALFVFFVCPVVICLVVDIVFFVLIARQITANSFRPESIVETGGSTLMTASPSTDSEAKKRLREEKRQKYLRRLGIYAKMALMMGLTWLIGCIAPSIPDDYGIDIVLWYAFVILSGLQGVFIFYTYVLNKKTLQVIRESYYFARHHHGNNHQNQQAGASKSCCNSNNNNNNNKNSGGNNLRKQQMAKRFSSDSKLVDYHH